MNWNEKDYSHLITNLWTNLIAFAKSISAKWRNRKAVSTYQSVLQDQIPSRAEYNVLDKLQKDYDQGKITVKEQITKEEYWGRVNAEVQRLAREQKERLGKDTQVWGGFKFPDEPETRIVKE